MPNKPSREVRRSGTGGGQVTIRHVARRAGVNPSTVSRVLASSSRISAATQRRVRDAVAALDYHPNSIAQRLVQRRSRSIGVVIPRRIADALANPFFPELLRGIGTVLQAERYNLVLTMPEDPEGEHEQAIRLLRGREVDGLILTGSRVHDRLIPELERRHSPHVLVGRLERKRAGHWIDNDNVGVGRLATEHLLELGHRRIAIITGPMDLVVSRQRLSGYRAALAVAGVTPNERYEVEGSFTRASGREAMARLLALDARPTALFACDDVMAIGAMDLLRERKVPVPDEISVVGVNDDPRAPYLTPPLTTVRIPIFEMGVTAATRLLDVLRGVVTEEALTLLPSEVVVRASSTRVGRAAGAGRIGH